MTFVERKKISLKKQLLNITTFLIATAIIIFSCKKENNNNVNLFYGNWKTSYGDTITFSKIGNKNILSYDFSLNPALPTKTNYEYTYQNNRLGIKNSLPVSNNYTFLESFRWLQQGQSFEVQGIHWFPFISSTQTYFTFTKIP
jgi:hypothetical protein